MAGVGRRPGHRARRLPRPRHRHRSGPAGDPRPPAARHERGAGLFHPDNLPCWAERSTVGGRCRDRSRAVGVDAVEITTARRLVEPDRHRASRARLRAGRDPGARRRPCQARTRAPRDHPARWSMICDAGRTVRPAAGGCWPTPAPPPGRTTLARRLGSFDDFVADLVARVEQRQLPLAAAGPVLVSPTGPLGTRWDVEGDPNAMDLVRLWAFVAEGLAAYTELTAGESYLATVARLGRPRAARRADRLPPERSVSRPRGGSASTSIARRARWSRPARRVQASGKPDRAGTDLRGRHRHAAVRRLGQPAPRTWVPQPATPSGRTVRFLGDPGFRAGDSRAVHRRGPAGAVTRGVAGVLVVARRPDQRPDAVDGHADRRRRRRRR